MRITNIDQEGIIYTVTKSPSFIEKIFGIKEKKIRYREEVGNQYIHFPGVTVFIREDGEVLGPLHKMTKILDRHKRSF